MTLTPLPPGDAGLLAARPGPDLTAHGYVETEYVLAGEGYATRIVVRRPGREHSGEHSGTLVAEWLNVSSGSDTAPGWTYFAEEIVRRGHVWAGISAQYAGVEGGLASIQVADLPSPGLRGADPGRYGDLHHPGDARSYDIFSDAVRGVRDLVGATRVLATGESQSAMMLVTYVNVIQPEARLVDGFLIHSRPAVAGPLSVDGPGVIMAEALRTEPVLIRDDLDIPVLVLQTEGDLLDRIGFLPARQPDTDRLRVWEVAGAAHADKYLIGELEELLGCAVPVNTGQLAYVARAALRHLDAWAGGGAAPPSAPPLEVVDDGFVLDDNGNARGGVRTPVVDAPVEVLSGRPWPGASISCLLFGSTQPLPPDRLAELYPSREAYLAAYKAASEAAINEGFVCPEDRDALSAEARPDLP